jgi:NAD(P)-dependent dehydrogenase (short-subunit alcohol dehydrogenase family)
MPANDVHKALDFTGKVAIVTGGARGVGRGITQRFLDAGAQVVVCGRTEPEKLPGAGKRRAFFVAADVREVEQIETVAREAEKRFGRIDVLVNNAGGAPESDAATASPRFSEAIVRLNLLAPLHFAQRANTTMQKQSDGGVIINIASVSGVRPSPGTAAYGAAKAGLLSLTQTLAVEWAPKVRVVAITAGMIRTEQSHLHYGDEDGIASIGEACLFLASPLAGYVSGASLLVHGGGEKPAFLDAANNTEKD